MSFKDMLKIDAAAMLNSDEFAEEIMYIPKDGWPRPVTAVINRQRLQPSPETEGRILSNQIEIVIANDATTGLTAIRKGIDAFSFPEFLEGDAVEWVVADVISHDEGMWHLLVER